MNLLHCNIFCRHRRYLRLYHEAYIQKILAELLLIRIHEQTERILHRACPLGDKST